MTALVQLFWDCEKSVLHNCHDIIFKEIVCKPEINKNNVKLVVLGSFQRDYM